MVFWVHMVLALQAQLQREGYGELWTHHYQPLLEFPVHEHPVDLVHVVIRGGMEVEVGGVVINLSSGERVDTPKNTPHCARMGPEGCELLIGARL